MPALRRATPVLGQVGTHIHSIMVSLLQVKENGPAEDKKKYMLSDWVVVFNRKKLINDVSSCAKQILNQKVTLQPSKDVLP